jgi:hypothetical protein
MPRSGLSENETALIENLESSGLREEIVISDRDDCGDLLDSTLPRNSLTTAATTGVTENWPTPRLPFSGGIPSHTIDSR